MSRLPRNRGQVSGLSQLVLDELAGPAALVSAPVDLYATVGSSAHIGFTAACGGSNDYHAIQSLTIVESAQ